MGAITERGWCRGGSAGYTPYPIALSGTYDNSAYLNDYCVSQFDCIWLRDVVAENGGWGWGGGLIVGYLRVWGCFNLV